MERNVQLVPGAYVRHPQRPDWGIGQVQSAIGTRVTVNFENAGKQLINTAVIDLVWCAIGSLEPGITYQSE